MNVSLVYYSQKAHIIYLFFSKPSKINFKSEFKVV